METMGMELKTAREIKREREREREEGRKKGRSEVGRKKEEGAAESHRLRKGRVDDARVLSLGARNFAV